MMPDPASFRFGLLFMLCVSYGTARAQSMDLMGKVVLHNGITETGRSVPVVGASLRAPQAKSAISDREGRFTLRFLEVQAGSQVAVTVSATDLVPLDPDALRRFTLGLQEVRVVMADPERLADAQLEYHNVAVGELERRHREELDRLRNTQRTLTERLVEFERAGHRRVDDLSEAMQVLEIERAAALQQIADLASRFARVDLDVASERYRQALTAFRVGRISETMALLDTAALDGEWRSAVADRERGERLVSAADKAIRDVLDAYELRADMLQTTLRYADALVALERATGICEEQPEVCDVQRRIRQASDLAYAHRMMGRYDVGLHWIEKAIQLQSRSTDPAFNDRISLLTTKSQLLRDRGEYEPAFEEASTALEVALGDAEVDATFRLLARFSVVQVLNELGRYDEVLLQAAELVAQARSAHPPEIRFEARGLLVLADAYVQKGRLDSALSMGERALELFKTIDKPGAPELIGALNNVALYHADLWNSEKALNLLAEARTQQLLSSPEDHPDVLLIDMNRATCWKDMEEWEEAGSLLEDVVERMRALLGRVHPKLSSALVSLGGVYIQQERTVDALRALSEARTITVDALGPEHPNLMNIHNSIAKTYLWSDRPDSALVHYDKALWIVKVNDSLPNADEALLRKNKATTYLDMEEYPNAIREGRAAIAAYSVSFGEEHREMGQARTVLGIALFKDGQLDEGDLEFERALRIHPFDRALYYRFRIAKQKGQDEAALNHLVECARLLPADPAQRNDTATGTMKELKEEAQRQGREDVLKEFIFE